MATRRAHAPEAGAPLLLVPLLTVVLLVAACGSRDDATTREELEGPAFGEVLEQSSGPPPAIPNGRPELWEKLEGFYELLEGRPAWLEGRRTRPQAGVLVEHLRRAEEEGLRPEDYGTQYLVAALEAVSRASSARELHQLDIALTYAAFHFGDHLLAGRVRPEQVDVRWRIPGRQADLVELFVEALAPGGDLGAALVSLRPAHPQYRMLAAHRDRYRHIMEQGGWPTVPEGPVLRVGEEGDAERLGLLAERLRKEGFLETRRIEARAPAREGEPRVLYDEALADAVSRFQRSRTLAEDGMLGPETQRELNVPAFERLAQIELNLERWRWMPEDLGSPAVLVNIPGFWLEVWEEGMPVMSMNVAVGEEGWETPVFSDEIQYLVLNPDWNLPDNIVRARVIPAMRENPSHLRENDMEVLRGWEPDAPRVDDELVFRVGEEPGLRVRRRPGPENPLGRIKFMFPNEFDIYLHDTPAGQELLQPERTLSHGCVRLERPLELAEYLLRPDGWDRQRLERAIATGVTRDVGLTRKVPVYLLYFTAVVREDGEIELYRDPYRIDEAQLRAHRE
jgi:L,D-transpeptidase YcbB